MINSEILNNLATAAHKNAVAHGFWECNPSHEHNMMLVLTEISEAVEADRHEIKCDHPIDYRGRFDDLVLRGYSMHDAFEMAIKNTKFDELADVCIRLLDMAGNLAVDFSKMNPCRYYRAFEKFAFTENAFGLAKGLTRETFAIERRIQFGLHYVQEWCYSMGESLEWYINAKMNYNKSREYMHGKQY